MKTKPLVAATAVAMIIASAMAPPTHAAVANPTQFFLHSDTGSYHSDASAVYAANPDVCD